MIGGESGTDDGLRGKCADLTDPQELAAILAAEGKR